MGVRDMFSEGSANFSGIPEKPEKAPKLFVQGFTHKAFIAVDEEGTEAAAAIGFLLKFTTCY